ncbi:pilus assembly protein TadG-related protein [Pseudomonas sp. PS01297]|uniref:pilus assembly protein TadG-related protein n=1 Tax=Pseudomonas sp. PS01297 TaxID=2991433 RepID=UPI00249BE47F|nr:pilus assembly protein TadG-related protein [Pseudomonas sp. PS01297]
MSPPSRRAYFNGPRQQHGAIGLMAALTLGMVLIFMLLVVDGGRLYLEQRKLQRVADMAVLEAVSRGGSCAATPSTATLYATQSAARNSFVPAGTQQTLNAACGTLVTVNQLRTFQLDPSKSDAIRVIATNTIPTSIAGGVWDLVSKGTLSTTTKLTASAVGSRPGPTLAQISIRTTLATVNTSQSPLLNNLFSGLLGGNVSISAVGWDGLAKANINLLQYLNQLAINLGVNAGDYTTLLNTNVTVTQLIKAAASVATLNGATLDVQTALANLQVAAINNTPLKVGDLLKLQTGTSSAGLDTDLNLFSLIQAAIQIANKNNAVAVSLPINILGLAKVTTTVKVIEPPQFSAIGNPATDRIYVRTAQVRSLITIELPILNTVSALLNLVTDLLSGITGLLQGLICGLGLCGTTFDIKILPPPLILSINLDTGGADALVTGYTCPSGTSGSKSLTVQANTVLANLNIGSIDASKAFSSSNPVTVTPLPIVNIISKNCGLFGCVYKDYGGGGIALMATLPIAKTPSTLIYSAATNSVPPNLKQPPMAKSASPTTNIVDSLRSTISNVPIKLYAPVDGTGILSALATGLTNTVNATLLAIVNLASGLITGVLSPLLDPLLNNLLSLLGINLMATEVDANLSCGQGGPAQLVL